MTNETSNPGEFITVADTDDVPFGQSRAFPAGGKMIALFHTDEGWYAIDDFCPHQGASLAEGHVEDDLVMCPWHAWRFSIKDGTWADNPSGKVKCGSYQTRVVDDEVQVLIPPREATC